MLLVRKHVYSLWGNETLYSKQEVLQDVSMGTQREHAYHAHPQQDHCLRPPAYLLVLRWGLTYLHIQDPEGPESKPLLLVSMLSLSTSASPSTMYFCLGTRGQVFKQCSEPVRVDGMGENAGETCGRGTRERGVGDEYQR